MERNSLIPHPDGGNVYHFSRLDLIERKNHALPIPSRAGQKNKRRAARSIQIFCLRPLVGGDWLMTLFVAPAPYRAADAQRFELQLALGLKQVVANINRALGLNDAQQRVGGGQHPRRRAGVPRPTSAPAVPPPVVDVGGLLERNEAVDRDALR